MKIPPVAPAYVMWAIVAGLGFGALMQATIDAPSDVIRREAKLPEQCKPGEQVLFTSAPTAELFVCEAHWVRK